jgi:hypothetical protein
MTANRSLNVWLLALIAASLVGCATPSIPGSYVDPALAKNSAEIGRSLATFVGETYPAPRSTILLIEPPESQKDNAVTQALTTGLLNEGFALVLPGALTTHEAHRLQYWVSAEEGSAFVRAQLDGSTAARLYVLDPKKTWVAQSPFTVRN